MNSLIWNGRAWAFIGLGVFLSIAEPSYAADPVADGDTGETQFGAAVVIDVVANDTDIDGDLDPTTIAIDSGPTHGTAVPNGSGAVTYTPAGGFSGPDSFTYTVKDTQGATSNEATVTITVQPPDNMEPNADAEPESQTGLVGTQVNLDGSASNDPDSGPIALTFQWSFTDKPGTSSLTDANISVSGPNGELASFTPDVAGTYKVTLTVFDGGLSHQDEVVIDVTVPNTPPNADAKPESQPALVGTQVNLDGSASNDPDAFPNRKLTFQWGFAQLPSGSALTDANITKATKAQASFTPDVAGVYRLRLTVSDGELSDSDDVDIDVTPAPADLELSLKDTPDPLTVDGQLTYTITVKNKGPGTATDVQVVDSLPPEAELAAPTSSSQGQCGGTGCDLGTLVGGAKATVTIYAVPNVTGRLDNMAEVFAAEPDPNHVNNSRTETTTVKEPEPDAADLAVTAAATPGASAQQLTYTLKVTNNGQATATGVRLTNDLPPGVDLRQITPSQTCHPTDPVLCDLGTLPSGETRIVTIDVTRTEVETLPNQAAINGDQLDPDPLNNFALTSALDLPKGRRTTSTCDSERCKVRLRCNLSDLLGRTCKNRVTLFVDTRARRTTRALQLSDARVARGRVRFATVRSNFLGGNTKNVRLKLTRKGREIASMLVQQGRKRFRGEMRIISNGARGQDIMRLWVRLK